MIFASKQKNTEPHNCGNMVFARQKDISAKEYMPEKEGNFALSLGRRIFELEKNIWQNGNFSPNIFPEVVASQGFSYLTPKHIYLPLRKPNGEHR